MNALAKYYEENLYPLQNGVLSIVSAAKTPFFLTGGTALSRFYTFHRYSDDLDFFVVDDPLYSQHVNTVLQQLSTAEKKGAFNIDRTSMERGKTYTQMHIITQAPTNIELKVEFINDVASHFGQLIDDPLLKRVDSLRNILSNKLTALFRSEPKDVADIRAIALHSDFNWKKIVTEAKSKEAGIDAIVLYDILRSFPIQAIQNIKWITHPDPTIFQQDLLTIAEDILYGRDNSLFSQNKKSNTNI